MPLGAIRSANAGFGGARASALVGEGSLRCRAVHGGVGVPSVSRVWTVYS